VYVTGYGFGGALRGWEIVTIKYDESGNALWASPARYNGSVSGGGDYGNAITVDSLGNVYVTGSSAQGVTGNDVVTLKYSPAGVLQWDSTYASLGSGDDSGLDIAVNSSGDVYVTGVANGDFMTLKYINGGGSWASVLDGNGVSGQNYDTGLALVLSGSECYATGSMQLNSIRKDYWTIKYNTTNGDTLWTRTFDRAGSAGIDIAYDITADFAGNVIVTGESGVYPPTHKDAVTIKYIDSGAEVWISQFDNGGADDWGEAVVTDATGHVYIAGTSGEDYLIARLSQTTGVTQWSDLYGSPGLIDNAHDMEVDSNDNLYVVGRSDDDYATLMYTNMGTMRWAIRYNVAVDEGRAIAVMDSNHVYVTGTSDGDFATIRYSQKPGGGTLASGHRIQLELGSNIDLDQVDTRPARIPPRILMAEYYFGTPGNPDKQGWTSHDLSGRGDFAEVFSGSLMVQEDHCLNDITYMWAFINGSTDNYTCDGWPMQLTVPYENPAGAFIQNEIWSPGIPWLGAGSDAELEFNVYRDLSLRALVFYTWRVRSWDGNTAGPWRRRDLSYYGHGVDLTGLDVDWFKVKVPFGDLIARNTDSIQVALGVWDMYDYWSGCYAYIPCHSHAPMYDSVRVYRLATDGPIFAVRDIDLFQDTWPTNGSSIGTGRIDMALDISSCTNPTIRPGDSSCVWVDDHEHGLTPDPYTGFGSAVYLYLARDPQTKPVSATATVAEWNRWPLVDSVLCNNRVWYQYRCDTAFTETSGPRTGHVLDRWCVDLNDNYFTSGDTLLFFFGAENNVTARTYWSQFTGNTNDILDVCEKPMEVQILPSSPGQDDIDILYVDYFSGRGAQPYFDTAFENMNVRVDRYDKRGPSSLANNGLASRLGDPFDQLISNYKKIIWNSGDLPHGTIGDGAGDPCKENDADILFFFLDGSDLSKGVYFSGDDLAEEWNVLYSPSAVILKDYFIPHQLVSGDHLVSTPYISPLVVGEPGGIFDSPLGPDTLIAYGNCPIYNDFDVIEPIMTSVLEATYDGSGVPSDGAIISNTTINSNNGLARVVLSGSSFHYIRDARLHWLPTRYFHLHKILTFLENIIDEPVGGEGTVRLVNNLAQNYPNPFNPATKIHYSIKQRSHVTLKIYNVAGQLVRTLVDELQEPLADGYTVSWGSRDSSGQPVASGVYLYKLTAKDFTQTRKMVLLK
jgi:hypothetical protein